MARKPNKRGPGKPTDYRPEYAEQAFKQCLAGATDKDLADFFGKAESTINEWKLKHPEFAERLRAGKEVAVGEVANSIYKAAIGYQREVQKMSPDGTVVTLIENVPPDGAMAKYFMNNRSGRTGRTWHNDPEVSVQVNNETLKLPQDIIEAARKLAREGK